jgi:peptidoglycan/xylan/chitin deacetylase (PgdA/CDA1 family)
MARSSRGFILAFHDVAPRKMEQLVDSLRPIEPVHLGEMVDRAKAGKPTTGLCAITVDDGTARSVTATAALCRRRRWPATFYLPTANLDSGEGLPYEWWRQVQPLLTGRRLSLPSGQLDLSNARTVGGLSSTMERLWHSAPLDLYHPFTMEIVAAVADELNVPIDFLRPPRTVSWAEVEDFARDEQFHFESLGLSHVAMSALSGQDLHRELRASRDAVTEHTGRVCRHLAYPFGSQQSIGTAAPVAARRYYDSAVTTNFGHVDAADPWLLPRIPLYAKNSTAMTRLKVLLHCSRPGYGSKRDTRGLLPVRADQPANSGQY